MNAAGPLSDRVVVALWRAGAPQAAMELAHAAIARGDVRWMVCRVALDRMQRGESPDEGGEVPALDLALASAMLDRGHLHEARCVLYGARLADPVAQRLAGTLDQALAPLPAGADPAFSAVDALVRAGQAESALRALEEVLRVMVAPPAWLTARHAALASLTRGSWRDEPAPLAPVTRETVLARIRARDLPAALEAARSAGARELAGVLERLLAATERLLDPAPDGEEPQTVPMHGHRLAELQVRMGALDEAERAYRSLLRHTPDDERARAMLADVIALRRALGEHPEGLPPRDVSAPASVRMLDKTAPRAGGAGWGGRYAAWGDDQDDDDSTANLDPAQDAELLLKLGRAAQALDVYRILAIQHPKQQLYRRRIAEIEAMIAQRMTPAAGEVTVKQDLSRLGAQAVPTNPRVVLPDAVGDDDEFPTIIDFVRGREK